MSPQKQSNATALIGKSINFRLNLVGEMIQSFSESYQHSGLAQWQILDKLELSNAEFFPYCDALALWGLIKHYTYRCIICTTAVCKILNLLQYVVFYVLVRFI